MSMLLWKTLALSGVIGVGSVVVVQAKRSLDQDASAVSDLLAGDEEFPLLDGDTGLETTFGPVVDGQEPRQLPDSKAAQALASLNPAEGDDDPFGPQAAAQPIARASAQLDDGQDPFAAMMADQETSRNAAASVVTLDDAEDDQVVLLDGAAAAPEQGEPNPFDFAQASEPSSAALKKLSPGNDGPVLMRPPVDEPADVEPASGSDDNPFAQFARPLAPRSAPPVAEADPPQFQFEPGPPQYDAPPELSAPPPLRTRDAVAIDGFDLPPATLNPEPAMRRRDRAPVQVDPEVVSQQDAGLAAPQSPKLPEVAPEFGAGQVRVAEIENQAANVEVETRSGAFPEFPPLNLTGGESDGAGPGAIPADVSSIPPAARPVPQEPAPRSFDRTIPNEASSIPMTGPEPRTPAADPVPQFDAFNPDESPTARPPAGQPASSIPSHSPRLESTPLPAAPRAEPPAAIPAQPDLSGYGVIDRDVATGPAQPQLTIVKQAPSEAVVGQDLEYSILVRNIGRSAAHNVVVEDLIPRGSKCTGTIPKAESQLEKKNLIWKLGTLAAGAEQLIRVRITPTDAGEIGSVATVSFSAAVAAKTVIVEPKAMLTVSGPREAVVGEPAQYRFTITNNGPVDLKGLFVRTVLPGQGLTHPGGNDLEYELGDLPRGKSREVSLAMTPSQAGDWRFDSMLNLNGRELSRAQSDLHVVGARLTVVRSGPTKRFVGRSATYSNSVTNNSSQMLSNVQVVETLPVGLDPSGQLSKDVRWDPALRTLTWVIPQLAVGQAVDLPVTVTPKNAGLLEGQIVARDASGNRAEIATALEVAGFSSLVVNGGHDGRPVAVGDQVSFRFTVRNSGTAAAERVAAMFDLPENVELINAQGPNNVKFEKTGKVVVFEPIPVVPVNGELTYDVVVQAKSATPPSGDRVLVSLYSTQLPDDRPLEQEQQLVIYGDDDEPQPVQRVSGVR